MDISTAYQVLELKESASSEDIKQSYRRLAKIWHPDVNKELGAEEHFKKALAVACPIDAKLEIASASFNLGLLYKQKGYKNKAREHLRQAQEIYSKIDTSDYEMVKEELLTLD